MSILEKLGNLFNKAESIPQIGEFRPQPMAYVTTGNPVISSYGIDIPDCDDQDAGDMLLEGTNGAVFTADNSSNVKWESLPSAGLPRDKYSCPWCGGYTFDDYLGQCAACGGPREKEKLENYFVTSCCTTAG